MYVLLVEPDAILARAYAKAFSDVHIDTTIVSSGQKAIDMADTHQPVGVVLEVQLAGQSGIDFLHEFRSYEDWNSIPVIIYSSVPISAYGVGKEVWERLGVKRYLYKHDVPADHMVAVVQAAIGA